MKFPVRSLALTLVLGSGAVTACGGATSIEFVGARDGESGGPGSDGSGGRASGGGSNLGGGDGSGGKGSVIASYCGDGRIDDGEECDDENEKSRDGCSSSCEVEPGYDCDDGEPTECTRRDTLGNGVLDPGEECDDGNTEDGDGCSSTGTIEATCDEPIGLEVEISGLVNGTGSITLETSNSVNNVPAQACGGLSLGDASDRVIALELPYGGDVSINLESDFDAILRVYDPAAEACSPKDELICINDVGAASTETAEIQAKAGTLHIVVDGATADDVGEFTLTVTTGCDLGHLKIHRLSPYQVKASSDPSYSVVSLKNTSDYCSFDLSNAHLYLTDASTSGEQALPETILPPGQVFRASLDVDAAINPNSYDLGLVLRYFDAWEEGAFLCDGACDLTGGTNITDAVVMGSATMPAGITFSSLPLPNASNSPHSVFVRVAYAGVAPNFLASDWSAAFLVDPDDLLPLAFSRTDNTVLNPAIVQNDPSEGAICVAPAPNTLSTYNLYSSALPVTTPTYISFKFQIPNGSTGTADSCYLGFGDGTAGFLPTTSSAAWLAAIGLQYSAVYESSPLLYFPTLSNQAAVQGTWHVVEYRDINWTSHTLTIVYDGASLGTVSFTDSTDTFANFVTIMPWRSTAGCFYSDIIVRNGPPGRIWESPPVLP